MATAKAGANTSPFIAELHGLRGIALALVVAFHVFTDRVSGGIDIFLFLTGFLITRTLVGGLERRTFTVDAFLSRLARRLLPLTALTVTGVAVATWLWMPQVRWNSLIADLLASLLFYENWHLVGTHSVYGSVDGGISPVQHFWSLAVQGQFYLIWLVAVGAAVYVGRRLGLTTRTSALAVIGTVVVLSFTYATQLVATDQPRAYLSTFTRLWELGLGGILALTIASVSGEKAWSAQVRWLLGWIGLALVLSCGFVLDAAGTFPGYQALWPLAGTTLVLVAGSTSYRFSADSLLRGRALHHVGDISFALYLWHWPVLVFCVNRVAPRDLSMSQTVLVLATSYVLAYISTKVVGRATRPRARHVFAGRSMRLRRLALPALIIVPTLAGLLVWQHHIRSQMSPDPVALNDPAYPGARAAPVMVRGHDHEVRPTPLEVADEGRLYVPLRCVTPPGKRGKQPSAVKTCGFGTPKRHATRTIAMVGASHVGQWVAPFIEVARANGWRVVVIQKNACQFKPWPNRNNPCTRWNESAMRSLRKLGPDLVVNLGTSSFWGEEQTPDGFVQRWRALQRMGIPVLAMRDTPRFPEDGAVCVDEHADDVRKCAADRNASLRPVSPFLQRDDIPPNVHYVDFTNNFCNASKCPAVIGNVLVMADKEHMTNLFSQTMRPYVATAIASVPGFSTRRSTVADTRAQRPGKVRARRIGLDGPSIAPVPGLPDVGWVRSRTRDPDTRRPT